MDSETYEWPSGDSHACVYVALHWTVPGSREIKFKCPKDVLLKVETLLIIHTSTTTADSVGNGFYIQGVIKIMGHASEVITSKQEDLKHA